MNQLKIILHLPCNQVSYVVWISIISFIVFEIYDTNFWKKAFFNNLLWKNGAVGFHEIICRVCLSC